MTPFLKQVARHYLDGAGNLDRLCFVLPNRRAVRFLEHYLGEGIAELGLGAKMAPEILTVNDFIFRSCGLRPVDRLPLLLELYGVYCQVNPQHEPLDDFLFWGDTLLGDFDDVDKYLVDAGLLFANVYEFKSLQDDYSYLTESQREAMERFTSHFLTPGAYKDKFLAIWKILLPLYGRFRERLDSAGMAYEGMVYRRLAERLEEESAADILRARFPVSEKFVFVGLNALSESEKKILRRMHRAGLCEFCWDYVSPMIRNRANKSSMFLDGFVQEFPQAFTLDPDGLPQTEFNLLKVPGGIAQAKQLPQVLARCSQSPGMDTAVVLPDENMLLPVLNSIPEHIVKLNVTMGYPIGGSQMWSLLSDLVQLQLHQRSSGGAAHFYHKYVWGVVSNSLIRSTISPDEKACLEECRNRRAYYVPADTLRCGSVLDAVFTPLKLGNDASAAWSGALCAYLKKVLVTIAPLLLDKQDMQLEIDFAKVCYETLDRLDKYGLEITPVSLGRLLRELLRSVTVPFEGEPLEGMQIMGPLEVRALDFDNLVILNFNEGVFPRRSLSASFVPPELRKGFGLPSYEFQDAVWAYYFYRMIQRASKVWMIYDSRTEGLKGGEPSRYLMQLKMHFGVRINQYEATAPLGAVSDDSPVPKTPAHLETLAGKVLSSTSIRNHINCPMRFYYSMVEGLKADIEVKESLDARTLGNVLHKTMQTLYPVGTVLDTVLLDSLIKDSGRIRSLVEKYTCLELNTMDISGRNIVLADIICSYVRAVLETDRALVASGGPVRIEGAELNVKGKIGGYDFKGAIDRLDRLSDGTLRVVDYKSGGVTEDDIFFNNDGIPQVGLQVYLYRRLLGIKESPVVGAVYQPAALMSGAAPYAIPFDPGYCATMGEKLEGELARISDLSVPWTRTTDSDNCKYCDFKAICGR